MGVTQGAMVGAIVGSAAGVGCSCGTGCVCGIQDITKGAMGLAGGGALGGILGAQIGGAMNEVPLSAGPKGGVLPQIQMPTQPQDNSGT